MSGSGSFCCLVETNLSAFNGNFEALKRAHYLLARANYRQTCVDLRDEVLQASWHEQNQFLHLTGVGVTGIVAWEHWRDREKWRELREVAHTGVHSMADELGLPRSKAVTTVKPSGSLSKLMSVRTAVPEGVHNPLGKYIFNNINFSVHDPIVGVLQNAGYHTMPNPYDETAILVRLPVSYDEVEFDEVIRTIPVEPEPGYTVEGEEEPEDAVEGDEKPAEPEQREETLYVNLESAVDQLERYKLLMEEYVDHNCSITVSYSPDEVPSIIDWLDKNWDCYVGVSFMYRNDPTKTARDLGYPYLPQEVVTKARFDEYIAQLSPFDLDEGMSTLELQDDECAGGACPVR